MTLPTVAVVPGALLDVLFVFFLNGLRVELM